MHSWEQNAIQYPHTRNAPPPVSQSDYNLARGGMGRDRDRPRPRSKHSIAFTSDGVPFSDQERFGDKRTSYPDRDPYLDDRQRSQSMQHSLPPVIDFERANQRRAPRSPSQLGIDSRDGRSENRDRYADDYDNRTRDGRDQTRRSIEGDRSPRPSRASDGDRRGADKTHSRHHSLPISGSNGVPTYVEGRPRNRHSVASPSMPDFQRREGGRQDPSTSTPIGGEKRDGRRHSDQSSRRRPHRHDDIIDTRAHSQDIILEEDESCPPDGSDVIRRTERNNRKNSGGHLGQYQKFDNSLDEEDAPPLPGQGVRGERDGVGYRREDRPSSDMSSTNITRPPEVI